MANIPTPVIPNPIEPVGGQIVGGVDTHADTHHAAVLDHLGRLLATRQFPTTPTGLDTLRSWLTSHGTVHTVGVEGTGSYGTSLTRHLTQHGLTVIDVDLGWLLAMLGGALALAWVVREEPAAESGGEVTTRLS